MNIKLETGYPQTAGDSISPKLSLRGDDSQTTWLRQFGNRACRLFTKKFRSQECLWLPSSGKVTQPSAYDPLGLSDYVPIYSSFDFPKMNHLKLRYHNR